MCDAFIFLSGLHNVHEVLYRTATLIVFVVRGFKILLQNNEANTRNDIDINVLRTYMLAFDIVIVNFKH